MPEIISIDGENEKDLKENIFKVLWEKFTSLERFQKFLLFTILGFIVFAGAITKITLDTRSGAALGPGRVLNSCDNQDYVNCLSSQFNVSFQIDQSTDPDATDSATITPTPTPIMSTGDMAKLIYNNLNIPLSYQTYLDTFKATGAKIEIGIGDATGRGPRGAWAMVPTTGTIVLYPIFFTGSAAFQRYLIVHESAHIFANSSQGRTIQSNLYNQVFKSGQDNTCFNSSAVVKTYALKPLHPAAENFADSVADTLLCSNGQNCNPGKGNVIADFPTTCNNTYNFIYLNALGILPPSPTSTPTVVATSTLTPTAVPTESTPATPTPTSAPSPTPVLTATSTVAPTAAVTPIPDQLTYTTSVFIPTGDTYVRSDYPNLNYWSQPYLKVKAGSPTIVSYVKFDLTSLSGLNIQKAVFNIKDYSTSQTGRIQLKTTRNKWTEKTITFNTRPASLDLIGSFTNPVRNGTYQVDITDWVKSKTGKRGSFTLENLDSVTSLFNSTNTASKPNLVVTYEDPTDTFSE